MYSRTRNLWALICGVFGCLCYGSGDWLMMYGDPSHMGKLIWLSVGTAQIPQWRYVLAMALAFPGIILYGIALFAVQGYIRDEKHKRIYHYLNAFGLTPWIALHLIYVVILSLFAWLNNNGFSGDAITICEALYGNFSWLIPVSEALMLPVFLYWFYLQITSSTAFRKRMAFTNVLVIFAVLKIIASFIPVSAFRLGFINGLMSESMIIWFAFVFLEIGLDRRDRLMKGDRI
ncbi:MAG: hypothetical protein K6B14_05585 [Lachnospiraceae bacterium]|nr:hypothetical protein [Lachnospiraceae bacterium]